MWQAGQVLPSENMEHLSAVACPKLRFGVKILRMAEAIVSGQSQDGNEGLPAGNGCLGKITLKIEQLNLC